MDKFLEKHKETIRNPIVITFLVCLVCSIFVAGAAIGLKPLQERNIKLNKQRIILNVAGLLTGKEKSSEIEELFAKNVKTYIVDLQNKTLDESGQYKEEEVGYILANNPNTSKSLSLSEDVAGIKRLENFTTIYTINDKTSESYDSGKETFVVLPIRSYGLWSTMFGYISLQMASRNTEITVKGVDFYQHGETPGLGGEIQNPLWMKIWQGKSVYSRSGKVQLAVVKGVASDNEIDGQFQIDGLAGATLTSRGVDNGIKYWLGKDGFYDVIKLFYK